ncbi:Protein FAR-RED ELONGATED HYPOCOTYL 3, partial [Mucuna pruriens]
MERGSVSSSSKSQTDVIKEMSSNEGIKDGNEETSEQGLQKLVQYKEEVEEPKVGMTFSSEQEIFNYYTNFAQQKGFEVYRRTSKMEEDGKKYFTLACVCSRRSESKRRHLLSPYLLTKTQCKARINACLCLDGNIRVLSVALEHNHELYPGKARLVKYTKKFKAQRKRKHDLSNLVEINGDGSIQSLAGEHGSLGFFDKNRRAFIQKASSLRFESGDAEAIQSYFVQMQKKNSGFYYVMDLDDDCRLRNVFWVDARSKAASEYFGDVVTLDTTYLTNKYNIPLALFSGVNHHGQSVLLGCALLSNEDAETFTWLFQTWLACMSGHAPNAIITSEDKAIKTAIEIVFPKARHRWCLWHIMERVTENLREYPQFESIKTDLHGAVYDSFCKDAFNESWKKVICSYNLRDNEWLNSLYNERQHWVPVYVKDTFWAGMSTIDRNESVHAFFDGYVYSKTGLKQFFKQFDNAMKDKVEKECLADFSSFNNLIPCRSHFGIENQFQKVYTNEKFKEFQEEIACIMYCNAAFEKKEGLVSVYSVVESILCRHILSLLKLIRKTESVPHKYVFSHWRKDLKRKHTLVRCSYGDLIANPEAERLDKMCNAFHEVACMGLNTDVDFLKVMKWIDGLKVELSCKKISSGLTETLPIASNMSMISDETEERRYHRQSCSQSVTGDVSQFVPFQYFTQLIIMNEYKFKYTGSTQKSSPSTGSWFHRHSLYKLVSLIKAAGTTEDINHTCIVISIRLQILQFRASGQNARHSHRIRLHPIPTHFAKNSQASPRQSTTNIARGQRGPRNHIFHDQIIKNPPCTFYAFTLPIGMNQCIAQESIRHHPTSNGIIMNLLDSQGITRGTTGLGNSQKHQVVGFDPTCPQRSIEPYGLIWKSMSGES